VHAARRCRRRSTGLGSRLSRATVEASCRLAIAAVNPHNRGVVLRRASPAVWRPNTLRSSGGLRLCSTGALAVLRSKPTGRDRPPGRPRRRGSPCPGGAPQDQVPGPSQACGPPGSAHISAMSCHRPAAHIGESRSSSKDSAHLGHRQAAFMLLLSVLSSVGSSPCRKGSFFNRSSALTERTATAAQAALRLSYGRGRPRR